MRIPSAIGIVTLLSVLVPGWEGAVAQDTPPSSANDFGGIGLVETPTARMAPAGSFELGAVAVNPYRRIYALVQLLDWLEVDFRYTDITNVLADGTVIPARDRDFLKDLFDFNGTGTVRDRGFDMKIRLSREGRFLPAIAVGLQDMFGRARFGGEYVVASKRVGAFDFHLGIGWGYLGSRDQFGNPLSALGNSFKRREAEPGSGTFNFGSYFSGRELALFGGVEWFTPLSGLSLKAEYSGADPAREPLGNRLDEDLPVNFALAYRPWPWLDLSLGFVRGNTLMARTALRFDLFDPPSIRHAAAPASGLVDAKPDVPVTAETAVGGLQPLELRLRAWLAGQGVTLVALDIGSDEASLRLEPTPGSRTALSAESIGMLFAALPERVDRLWVGWQGERSGDMRLYLRGAESDRTARNIAALATSSGPVAAVRIAAERLDIVLARPTAPEGTSFPAAALLGLPEEVQSLRWLCESDVCRELALDPLRPAAQAEAILSSLAALPVTQLRLRGRALLEVTTADASTAARLDTTLEALKRQAGVGQVILAEEKAAAEARSGVAQELFRRLRANGIEVRAVAFGRQEATLWIGEAPPMPEAQLIGRAARELSELAATSVTRLAVARLLGKAELYRVSFLRRDLIAAIAGRGSPEEVGIHRRFDQGGAALSDRATVVNEDGGRSLRIGVAPVLEQAIGNPASGVYLADLDIDLLARAEIVPGLYLSGAVRRFIAGNLDQIADGPPTPLPRVRSDIRRYVEEGRTSIPYLAADYIFPLGDALLGRVSAGLFEPMFGGVGGEILYRPQGARWALGGEVNWVKQRDFDQLFGFRGYDTVTGDISLYTEWAEDIRGILRVGRFLAGDYGATIDLSRGFANGVRVGAFLTTTSDVRDEFGVDNLDKGVYISVPLEAFWPFGGPRESVGTAFRELTRDSGQRLRLNERLYDLVARQQRSRILDGWGRLLD